MGRNFAHAEELGDSVRQLGAELEAIVGGKLTGHPNKGMHLPTTMSAVPSVENSAAETAYMSAHQLKRSVEKRM